MMMMSLKGKESNSIHTEYLSKRHVDHDMSSFEMPLERKKPLSLEQ